MSSLRVTAYVYKEKTTGLSLWNPMANGVYRRSAEASPLRVATAPRGARSVRGMVASQNRRTGNNWDPWPRLSLHPATIVERASTEHPPTQQSPPVARIRD